MASFLSPAGLTQALHLPSQAPSSTSQSATSQQVAQQSGDGGGASSATGTDATSQAAAGATAVAAAPSPAKIVLSSVLRGAVSGASLMFGANKFMPGLLGKIVSFIPFLSKVEFPLGTVAALGIGAAVGAAFGLFTGIRSAKKQVAAYEQQAAAATTPDDGSDAADPNDPNAQLQTAGTDPNAQVASPDPNAVTANPNAAGAPQASAGSGSDATQPAAAPAPSALTPPQLAQQPANAQSIPMPRVAKPAKAKHAAKPKHNPKMSTTTTTTSARKRGGVSHHVGDTNYHIVRGDTLWAISRRYHTSIAAIMAANKGRIDDPNLIYAGDWIDVPRRLTIATGSTSPGA